MLFNTVASSLACFVAVSSALLLPPAVLSEKRHEVMKADVTYFQGVVSGSKSCGSEAVATGTITSGKCIPLTTAALSITPLNTHNCKYTVYKGSADCEANGSTAETTLLPAGSEPVCLNTGVLDAGNLQLASAMLHCGPEVSAQSSSRVRRSIAQRDSSPPPSYTALPYHS